MWDEILDSWREKLSGLNNQLLDKYQGKQNLSFSEVRSLISRELGGTFRPLVRLNDGEIKGRLGRNSIIGVDGSVNTVGTTFPHYITLFQALAKSSRKEEGFIMENDLHTPLISKERAKMVAQAKEGQLPLGVLQEQIKSTRLAQLELEVAYRSLGKFNPFLIVFDGPLWRYQRKAPELWEKFYSLVLDKRVLVAGVIEEVSSIGLVQLFSNFLPEEMRDLYDRELLFGALDRGEVLEIRTQELKEGFLTCFLRPSSDPQVVAFDFLAEQAEEMGWLTDLLFTLTPKEGRGIPLWLDIVDKEVRITKQLIDSLIDSSLSPELVKKLLLPKKINRIY